MFGAAAILLVVVGVMYYRDRQKQDETPPPPVASPGGNQLINVVEALRAQGLKTEILPRTARADELSEVAQGLTVDGAPLYVFLYPDTAGREGESKGLDPATLAVRSASGTPVATGTPHVISHSNVIAALYGGSSQVAGKVDAAINGLP
jgi:hypothetical protein